MNPFAHYSVIFTMVFLLSWLPSTIAYWKSIGRSKEIDTKYYIQTCLLCIMINAAALMNLINMLAN